MFKPLNEFVNYTIDDGIFIAYYQHGVKVGLEEAKRIVKDRLAVFGGKRYPVLIVGNGGTPIMSKEARDFFARGDGVKGFKALAIVVDNFLFKILGNLFVNFSNPQVETKIFSDKEEAKVWLKQFD
jgi:hypothetical protein